jgi:hypothetical protein
MKYLRKFNESNIISREWEDMSNGEREETDIPSYKNTDLYKEINSEDDIDFIITKIKEQYPKEGVSDKNDLIDMICWFEDQFKKDIVDEDEIIHQLGIEYGL